MSIASFLTRFLFFVLGAVLVVASLPAYASSLRQDNLTQEAVAPKRLIHMKSPELEAAVITRVEPIYPAVAAWAGVSGTVYVQVLVNQQGDVISTFSVLGHSLLKNAASTAARDWKLKPGEADGKPVNMDGTVTIRFPTVNSQPGIMAKGEQVENAKAAVLAFPSSPEAYYWLGAIYAEKDQNQDAVKAFNKAIELKPNYEEAYKELIDLYAESKATADVLSTYQKAVENNPNSLTLLTGQARALGNAKRYADAIEVLKRAIDLNSDDFNLLHLLGWDYMQLKRFDEAVTAINEELKLSPDNPMALHNLGWSYYRLKRYDESVATYRRIINLKRSYDGMNKVYRELGWAMLQSNRTTEAIDVFSRSIELKGDLPDVYCGLGAAYIRAGRLDEAIEALKKGAQERPKDSCIYDDLGVICIRMGKLQEAEPYFRKAIELSPDKAQAYVNLAAALRQQKKDAEAESVLRQGIKSVVDSDNASIRSLLGSMLAKTKWSEAEAQFKEVLRTDPNNAFALNDYGYYLAERGERLNEALDMTERAVNAVPDNGAFLDSLGWAYFKLGRLEEAERCLNKALQGSYRSTAVYEHLGDVYEKQGHRDLAIGMWHKALGFNPKADDINRLKVKLSAEPSNKK